MNDSARVMILFIMILWVISPIDACPGPVDDFIVILLGMMARRGLAEAE